MYEMSHPLSQDVEKVHGALIVGLAD